MKTRASARAAPLGWLLAVAPVGLAVRIERPTPVFAQPSAKARPLADVDPGTVLLFRSASARGLWVELEDEDGHRGWVPVNRTDYVSSATVGQAPASGGGPEPLPKEEAPELPPPPPKDGLRWSAGPLVRATPFSRLGRDPQATRGVGAQGSVLFPLARLGSKLRPSWAGFQAGWLRGYEEGRAGGFSVPVRYRMWSQERDSWWGMGPDVGLLYYRGAWGHPAGSSLSLGYSMGLAPSTPGFEALLRVGGEFFGGRRLSFEFSLNWTL